MLNAFKRRTLATLLAVFLLLSVFGCTAPVDNQTSDDAAVQSTAQPTATTTENISAEPAQSIVWKWTTTETEGTVYWEEWKSIFDDLEARTNGEIKVEMYAGGAIAAGEQEILQGVQQGSIDMAQISASILSNIVPEYNVLSLPFLFDDFEHMERFNDTPECKELLGMLEQYGIKQYRLGNAGFAYPNSKKPITSLEDFKGVKWRTMQVPVQLDTMKALGAVPIAVSYGEVYNALKTNLVDAWHNAGSAFEALSTYEAAKYVTELPLFSFPGTFILSSKSYDALSERNKAIVDELFMERLPHSFQVLYSYNMDALDVLVKDGKVELIHIDDFTPFRDAVASVYSDFLSSTPSAQKYLDAINASR